MRAWALRYYLSTVANVIFHCEKLAYPSEEHRKSAAHLTMARGEVYNALNALPPARRQSGETVARAARR